MTRTHHGAEREEEGRLGQDSPEITPLAVTASGTTWTQYKTGGLKLLLDKAIAANAALANPTVAATTASSSSASSLPLANGYQAFYTWTDNFGETTVGASASVAFNQTSATTNLNTVTIPALPAGALFATVYLLNPQTGKLVPYATNVTTTTVALSGNFPVDFPAAPPPTNRTGAAAHTAKIYSLLYGPNTDLVLRAWSDEISNHLSGFPIALKDMRIQAQSRVGIVALWAQAMTEAQTLTLANLPTTLGTKYSPIGMPPKAGAWTLP